CCVFSCYLHSFPTRRSSDLYASILEGVTDNIVLLDSDVTALEALSKGKHDAVVTDFITGKEGIASGMEIVGKQFIEPSEQAIARSEEHTSELQSRENLVCRL